MLRRTLTQLNKNVGRRIVLAPPDERLHEQDFLGMYDALKRLDPECNVLAHVTPKARFTKHMADMTMQLPKFKGPQDTQRVAELLARQNASWTFDVADYNIHIALSHRTMLSLNVGEVGASIETLNGTGSEARRKVLRASLGCDEEMFIDSLNDMQYRYINKLNLWAQETYNTNCHPPFLFWAQLFLERLEKLESQRLDPGSPHRGIEGEIAVAGVQQAFLVNPVRKTRCPICPDEEMSGIQEVANLTEMLRPKRGAHTVVSGGWENEEEWE